MTRLSSASVTVTETRHPSHKAPSSSSTAAVIASLTPAPPSSAGAVLDDAVTLADPEAI